MVERLARERGRPGLRQPLLPIVQGWRSRIAALLRRSNVVLVLTAIALVFAMATGFILLYRLVYLLGLVWILGLLWCRLGLRGLQVTAVRRARKAQVGDSLVTVVGVQNSSWLPKLWVEVGDLTDLPVPVAGQVINVAPHRSVEWQTSTLLKKRGVYTLGPVRASVADPFGIHASQRYFGGTQELAVYPATVDLPYFHLPLAELVGEEVARQRSYQVSPSASSVREYAYGDTLNRIHWPSTARMGRLMVKEFDVGEGSIIWVFLDLERRAQAGDEVDNSEEVQVSIAASLVKKYLNEDWSVGLVANGGDRYVLSAESGSARLEQALEFLTRARADGTTPLGKVIAGAGSLLGPLSTMLLVTPSLDPEWTRALDSILRRRVRAAVILVEPSSFGAKGGAKGDSSAVIQHVRLRGVPVYTVRRGDDLGKALHYRNAQ
ncbi:MAG: DUF58 domain-containing protein [Chloroflexi bacterium]|nr:DUF58 domain-containing protein [Chloroflexota bacterium]